MKILMIGNSLTTRNDMPQVLSDLMGANIRVHARGGASLAEHVTPKTEMGEKTLEALYDERWDYVVLQEQSMLPIENEELFCEHVKMLCELIEKAGGKPVLYATWAYRKDSEALKETGMEYSEMYRRLRDAFNRAAAENGAVLANVGKAFYYRSKHEELYEDDGVHPNKNGSRVAALTIQESIANWLSISNR